MARSDINPYVVNGEVCQDFRIGVVEMPSKITNGFKITYRAILDYIIPYGS